MDVYRQGDKAFKIKFKTGTVLIDENFVVKIIGNETEKEKVIPGPGEYEIAGVSAICLPDLYLFEGDGISVLYSKTGKKLTGGEMEDLGGIDILIVPAAGSLDLVKEVEPYIVIPMQYDETHIKTFLADIGLTVEQLPKLSIKAGEFGETEKVVVLEKK